MAAAFFLPFYHTPLSAAKNKSLNPARAAKRSKNKTALLFIRKAACSLPSYEDRSTPDKVESGSLSLKQQNRQPENRQPVLLFGASFMFL